MFPWISKIIAQWSAGAGVCFPPRERRWRWSRLRVCNVIRVFKLGKPIQVFNWILVSVEITMLRGFNLSEHGAKSHVLLVCNSKVFRMAYFDMFSSPAVWGGLVSAWKFRAKERSFRWHCWWHAQCGVYTVERNESWCWVLAAWCVRSWYFQLSCEIYWASIPSQGGFLHARSCKNTACAISHNTMTKIKLIQNPWIEHTLSNPKTSQRV